VKSIAGEDARPTLAPVDAQARAAFFACKALQRADQRKPASELAAAACGDGAELAAVCDVELGYRRSEQRLAVPGKPEQRRAVVQVLHDPSDVGEVIAFCRLPDERRNQRPRLVHARGVDAHGLVTRLNVKLGLSSCSWPIVSRRRSRGKYGRPGHCWYA